eukprot:TRINITY_DN6721_c0_g1_i2.p1 TRINITY_DN6721_c0_g1~~TRINITY_DN6721_c0_g1_i2.p1  ORF type:complete len:650 (+),score=185.62 TRINITY_DN6721_c0_g1_i2:71-2020(+)
MAPAEAINGYGQAPGATVEGSARLADLRRRAGSLRAELRQIELQIEEEMAAIGDGKAAKDEAGELLLHHRPSWSMLGGAEGAPFMRQLSASDEDYSKVISSHPALKVEPIGQYNHWDRRECAVQNPGEWKAACEAHMKSLGGRADIPKVIHQIWIGPREPPCLWIDTFRCDFLKKYPSWSFNLWSDDQVAKLPMLNEKIYSEERMWQCKADILRLELLWHHGGLYVDADMVSVDTKALDPILEMGKETGFVIAYEPDTKDKPYSVLGNSVIGCTPHHPLILMLILYLKQTFYQKRNVIEVFEVTGPVMYTKCLIDAGMPLHIAPQEMFYPAFHFVPNPDAIDYSRFPKCLMFQFGYTCSGLEGYVKRKNRCRAPWECPFHMKRTPMGSYRKLPHASEAELFIEVPISVAYLEKLTQVPQGEKAPVHLEDGVAMFLTDGEVVQLGHLRQQLPGFVDRCRHENFDVMLFGIEWNTGSDEIALFQVPPGGRPKNAMVCGILVNAANSRNPDVLRQTLAACVNDKGFDPTALFHSAHKLNIWFAAQKYVGTMEESRLLRAMPTVYKIFNGIAQHHPPMHFDRKEIHGDIMKGWEGERLRFELKVEQNGSIQWRCWNDDNSPNCEMRSTASKVEWMKVFFNHQVVCDVRDKPVP